MKSLHKIPLYVGLFMIPIGIGILMTSKSATPEIPLLTGLFFLLISSPTREDERSMSIKCTSTFLALILGYSAKIMISNLYQHQLISFELISINYFLIMVFTLANVIRFSRLYFF